MRSPRRLDDYAAYLFDVDGTLLSHDHAVPGAGAALRALKMRGKNVLAVTNNSSLARHELAERFREFGLPLDDHEVFSALVATAQLVAHEKPGARVHVFGNPGVAAELARLGLTLTDGVDADYVVVGNHRGISYDRLTVAMRALLNGARFVAINVDRTYVGDNPEADIEGAHAAGMDALLVLTGVAINGDEAVDPPEHILPSVAELTSDF